MAGRASAQRKVSAGLVLGGRYELLRPLGAGGMGEVWHAKNLVLDQDVAVKVMLSADANLAARFTKEAKAAAKLNSPHVIQILDHGEAGGVPYIVMEFLRGEDLSSRFKRKGRLTIEELEPIVVQIVRALRVAHAAEIVHRDLKPANIFLVANDDQDLVKLLDFGVAKGIATLSDDESTKSDEVLGSPHFMSPEQIRSARRVDGRADLWSLGVVMYRALTGKRPFEGPTMVDVLMEVCSRAPARPTALVPALPPEIDAFFDRALEKDADARFATAKELLDAFLAIARPSRASVAAEQPSATPPLTKNFGVTDPLVPANAEIVQAALRAAAITARAGRPGGDGPRGEGAAPPAFENPVTDVDTFSGRPTIVTGAASHGGVASATPRSEAQLIAGEYSTRANSTSEVVTTRTRGGLRPLSIAFVALGLVGLAAIVVIVVARRDPASDERGASATVAASSAAPSAQRAGPTLIAPAPTTPGSAAAVAPSASASASAAPSARPVVVGPTRPTPPTTSRADEACKKFGICPPK